MKKTSILLAALAATAAIFAPSALLAAATYETTDNDTVLVVTVGTGETESLDTTQVTSGITNIVKRGAGTLVGAAISDYEGDFDIEKGVWQCKVNGDFGKTSTSASSGTVHVRDGASIDCAPTITYPGIMNGKTVHLYGAAADGASGKIFLSTDKSLVSPGIGNNMTIILHDDATLSSKKRFLMTGTFDLDGHVLSFAGRQQFDIGGSITNGGSVVLKSGTTLMSQTEPLKFAANCAATSFVKLESNATLNLKVQGVAANGWTLQNDGGAFPPSGTPKNREGKELRQRR